MTRSAKYIGGPLWRKKDLTVIDHERGRTLIDKPSGMKSTYYIPVDLEQHIQEFAHRVRQWTT